MEYINFIFIGILFCAVSAISAQSLEEARALYNEGGTAMSESDLETAVQKFNECIEMCAVLYEEEESIEAEELMFTVQQNVPKLYLQISQQKAQEKDYNGSLENAIRAKESANEIGNEDIASKASDLMVKIYYSFGLSNYKAKKPDEALANLDNAIEQDENYFKAHYLKVVILKDKGDNEALIAATKDVVNASGKNDETREKTISFTANYFYNEGVKAKQASEYDKAVKYINTSLEFNAENPDSYYLLVTIYNSQEKWDKTIAAGKEGLKCTGESDKVKFYYELGNAYYGNGDNTSACEAYKKAAVGDYEEYAKYQMEHVVKCE
ncbi:MAG: hypothetical protein JW894_00715 [Bacteroidales bacterium]|nr:hypothetical protein [Bacteroidales bacterium]